ncbi:hypothetical protein PoB_006611400 [Plakobranchus ocellatus]|uniref:CX domain-containing protein n=1 Tax=Plakobranchus ocellatus TaxID=259542 RepID=A0AAV4D5Y7_9GAST|nr:hypothetical protein PoB_006611400 [Plakobranchus ocellatus]
MDNIISTWQASGDVSASKCYRNEAIGDRDGNVYYCNSKDLSRCCVENEAPTCCKSESAKNLEEQLQLWGTVAAMILAIALIFICCKNDIACCTSDTSLRERIQNFSLRNRNKPEHLKEEDEKARTNGNFFDNPVGPQGHLDEENGTARTKGNFFDDPVGPPFYNQPPTNHSFPTSRALDPYNFPPLPPITPDNRNY